MPVRVLYHNPEIMIEDIMKFGGLPKEDSKKIENLWKEIINNHCKTLSKDYKFEIAKHSGHFIHLTDREKLYEKIEEIFCN